MEQNTHPLHVAIRDKEKSNASIVRLIKKCSDVNTLDVDGNTPLHVAVEAARDPTILKALIAKRANLAALDKRGRTPLHLAFDCKLPSRLVPCILKDTINVNSTDTELGRTLLHAAIAGNCEFETIKSLVEKGANPEAEDERGRTPLHFAFDSTTGASETHLLEKIISHLLVVTQNMNSTDSELGRTALYAAIEGHCAPRFIRALVAKGASLDVQDKLGRSPLHFAFDCKYKQEVVMIYLIENTTDVNRKDNVLERTCVFSAIEAGCPQRYLRALLEKGADFNTLDKRGRTPLHFAFDIKFRPNQSALYFLAEHTTNVNSTDVELQRTLLFAAVAGDCSPPLLQILVNKGADLSTVDKQERTLLHFALDCKSRPDRITFFFDNTTDVNTKDNELNRSPIFSAIENNCPLRVLHSFFAKGVDFNVLDNRGRTPLHFAFDSKYKQGQEAITYLVDKTTNVNSVDGELKRTLLFAAIEGNCLSNHFHTLVEKGADLNVKDGRGRTLLHYAFDCDYRQEIITYLLENTTDVNSTDSESKRTLIYAAMEDYASASTLQAILEKGANLDVRDKRGRIPLHFAFDCKYRPEMISYLIEQTKSFISRDSHLKRTLIFAAIEAHCSDVILRSLVEKNCRLNVQDKRRRTPLHYAFDCHYRPEVIPYVLEHTRNLNSVDSELQRSVLFAAIDANCGLKIFRNLVAKGAKLNARDKRGRTLLHFALDCKNRPKLISYLLKHFKNINSVDSELERSILFAAVDADCSPDIFHDLVAKGADLNVRDKRGRNLLHFALDCNYRPEVIRYLLENTEDVNSTDEDLKRTVLHAAIERKSEPEILRTLVAKGSDLDVLDGKGRTALHLAFECGYKTEDMSFLLENTLNVNSTNVDSKYTLLHSAISKKCAPEILQLFVANGANLDAQDNQGRTPLFLAFEFSYDSDKIPFLLENSTNVSSYDDLSILQSAMVNGCKPDMFRKLVAKCANLNSTHILGLTPLHFAIERKCNPEIISILLKNITKKQLNTLNGAVGIFQGRSLLHAAVEAKYDYDIIQALVVKGVDANILDKRGFTALHCALNKFLGLEVIRYLFAKTTNINDRCKGTSSLIYSAVRYGNLEVLQHLVIAKGVDCNVLDSEGRTPLHFAFDRYCAPDIILFLIEHTTKFDGTDIDGNPFLHAVVKKCSTSKILRTLVRKGANLNATDSLGRTPLHFAIEKESSDRILLYLIIHTTNINTQDFCNLTPLYSAISQRLNPVIIRALLKRGAYFIGQENMQITPFDLAIDYLRLPHFKKTFPKQLKHLKTIVVSQQTTLYDALVLRQPHDWNCVDRPLECLTDLNKPFWSVIMSSIVAQRSFSLRLHSQGINLDEDSTLHIISFLQKCDVINLLLAYRHCLHLKRRSESPLSPTIKRQKL